MTWFWISATAATPLSEVPIYHTRLQTVRQLSQNGEKKNLIRSHFGAKVEASIKKIVSWVSKLELDAKGTLEKRTVRMETLHRVHVQDAGCVRGSSCWSRKTPEIWFLLSGVWHETRTKDKLWISFLNRKFLRPACVSFIPVQTDAAMDESIRKQGHIQESHDSEIRWPIVTNQYIWVRKNLDLLI